MSSATASTAASAIGPPARAPSPYSTAVTHEPTPAPAPHSCAAGGNSQMYRQFARPYAQGKTWGWFYDEKGGWKVGICGRAYRHALSLRNGDEAPPVCSSTTSSTVLPTTASTSTDRRDQWRFAHRLRHRDANTDCNGDVGLLETHRQTPARRGLGTIELKVTDRSGTFTTAPAMTSDFYSYASAGYLGARGHFRQCLLLG